MDGSGSGSSVSIGRNNDLVAFTNAADPEVQFFGGSCGAKAHHLGGVAICCQLPLQLLGTGAGGDPAGFQRPLYFRDFAARNVGRAEGNNPVTIGIVSNGNGSFRVIVVLQILDEVLDFHVLFVADGLDLLGGFLGQGFVGNDHIADLLLLHDLSQIVQTNHRNAVEILVRPLLRAADHAGHLHGGILLQLLPDKLTDAADTNDHNAGGGLPLGLGGVPLQQIQPVGKPTADNQRQLDGKAQNIVAQGHPLKEQQCADYLNHTRNDARHQNAVQIPQAAELPHGVVQPECIKHRYADHAVIWCDMQESGDKFRSIGVKLKSHIIPQNQSQKIGEIHRQCVEYHHQRLDRVPSTEQIACLFHTVFSLSSCVI